jgi:hypothetical protein
MNAATVSRFLGKTFRKSVSTKTKIRGWHNTTAGTIVSQNGKNVLVEWTNGNWKQNNIFLNSNNEQTDMDKALRDYLTQNEYVLATNEKYILVIGKKENAK